MEKNVIICFKPKNVTSHKVLLIKHKPLCFLKNKPISTYQFGIAVQIGLFSFIHYSHSGMFQATKYTTNGETNTYVDGGVLCNYPIHSYDGECYVITLFIVMMVSFM